MRGGLAFLVTLALAFPAAAADAYVAIPVPAATLYPGDVLTAKRIASRRYRRDWVDTQPFARDAGPITGLSVKRLLPKGRPIPLDALGPADLVSEGDMVTALFEAGGLRIAARMMALDGGARHAVVRLRNPETGTIVSGVVSDAGAVVVPR